VTITVLIAGFATGQTPIYTVVDLGTLLLCIKDLALLGSGC